MDVLNEGLYGRLHDAFGPVKVSNQGQKLLATDGDDMFAEINGSGSGIKGHKKKPGQQEKLPQHLQIMQDGEYYAVNCPWCGDTRQRLYVNHAFGQKSDAGRIMDFLVICYNEGCMNREENLEDFRERLKVMHEDLQELKIKPGKVINPADREVLMPGCCRRLDDLPDDHEARDYVRSRRFDPDRLAKAYGVSYCVDSMYVYARKRLIIPVTWTGKLVGWQTRYVGELPWKKKRDDDENRLPPKYWTMPGMPRGTLLANFHNAVRFRTGVLVEGWFDVFGFGPMAMPILGGTVTGKQQQLFASAFGKPGRSGVFLLDPEEFDKPTTQRTIKQMKVLTCGQMAAVKLPEGKDPGNLDREFMRDYVAQEAKEQGVKVDFGWVDG